MYKRQLLAVIGHTFSIFDRFKGGKAVATSAGVILGFSPLFLIYLLVVFIIVLWLFSMISLSSVIGAVFALVGLINFINLVMTNIVTRRHEFATMQSIGMTNRQLRKMMISESFSYVLLAGIVGTLVAATLGMTLLRAFVENGPTSMMMTFQITLLPALIMLVLFLVLAFIVPVVALRLLNNRSVVERLRVNE